MSRQRRRRGAIFGAPIVLAVVTLAGLVIGLLGDGWHDCICALALVIPVAVMARSLARARSGGWDG